MKWSHQASVVVPVVGLLLAVQCGTGPGGLTGVTQGGGGGGGTGSCLVDGQVRDCHVVTGQHQGYVDCFNAQQTCIKGQWGPCDGSGGSGGGKLSMKALAPSAGGGLSAQSLSPPGDTNPPCSLDPCNPYCWGFHEVPPSPIGPTGGCMITTASGSCEAPTNWLGDYNAQNLKPNGTNAMTCSTAAPGDNCAFDSQCVAGTCTPFASGQQSASCGGQVDFTLEMPCWDGTHFDMAVCNRGTVAATNALCGGASPCNLPIAHQNGTASPAPAGCTHALNGPAGGCTIDLATTPIPAGGCLPLVPATDARCTGISESGDNFYFVNYTAASGVPALAECDQCNNYSATKDTDTGAAAACVSQACGSAAGTCKSNAGGYGSLPPADQDNVTTCIPSTVACATTPAGLDTTPNCDDCNFDTHCNAGSCTQWTVGAYSASAGGADLTLGYQCLDTVGTGTTYHFPVCNRGSSSVVATSAAPIKIGLYVAANITSGAPLRANCVELAAPSPPDDKEVHFPSSGSVTIAPGTCVDVNSTNSTNTAASGDLAHVGERVVVNWDRSIAEVNYCNNWNMEDNATCTGGSCGTGCITTVSGTVYDPASVLPLPGITVFQPSGAITPFVDGVACDTCTSLSSVAFYSTTSNTDGTFTLQIDTSGGTTNVPVVVQTGRWRRQITIPSLTACMDNPQAAGTVRLPQSRAEGDIPKTAIALSDPGGGQHDPLECLLIKMGISSSEIQPYQTPTDTARFQTFYNPNTQGTAMVTSPASVSMTTQLFTAATLSEYTSILFDCSGAPNATLLSSAQQGLFVTWANTGGRAFLDHYEESYLIEGQPAATMWPGTATWGHIGTNNPAQGELLTGAPRPSELEAWMALGAVGGTTTFGAPYFSINQSRGEATAVNAATSTEWARGEKNNNWGGDPSGDFTVTYSFQTPIGAPTQCGEVFFNDMHVSPTRRSGTTFPTQCNLANPLLEDEKALEYLIFASTACLGALPPPPPPPPPPPTVGPPPPPLNYSNTYSMSTCPPGSKGIWNDFSYNVTTPTGTDVKFAVQTGPAPAGPWSPAGGNPAGVLVADAPVDHPGGDGTGAPSCTMTGPSPCGNNCSPFTAANASGACPAACTCPIDVSVPLKAATVDPTQPDLQLNVLLTPSAASCAGILSPGLLTVANGVSSCPGNHNANGGACTAANQYTTCDQDYHCDLVATSPTYQTCIWNMNPVWIDPSCIVGSDLGFDLTIEPGCTDASGNNVQIPVCNRGGAAIPAGQTIVITSSTYSGGCGGGACGGPGTADCSYALTSALNPGACINIPPSAGCSLGAGNRCLQVNPGNTVTDVNGHKECNTTANGATWPVNGTGGGCGNNDTYVKNSPAGCEVCGAPLSGGAVTLNSWDVTYSCVPSE